MKNLTKSERYTINSAVKIIQSRLNTGSSWQLYVARYSDSTGNTFSACYFDSAGVQHSSMYGKTPADVIAKGIASETLALRNGAELRKLKVERLRKELAELTGEIEV